MSPTDDRPSFEQQIARLQEIVTQLESEDLPLEKGVTLFQEGTALAKACREHIKDAKHTVQIYSQGLLQDLDQEETDSHESTTDETET